MLFPAHKLLKAKKDITIHDLAKEMDLSPSTISRALKDHPSIGEKTRVAVKKLADLRGYRPNIMAVSLRNQKSKTIGVVISWIDRPFYSGLIAGIEEEARKHGYNVIISQTCDRYQIEQDIVETLYDMRIAGLIVSLSMETLQYDHFQKFLNSTSPVVFVDRVPDIADATKIVIDNFEAAYTAVSHLVDQGCKTIGYIGGNLMRNIYSERYRGYQEALQRNNLKLSQSLIRHGKILSYQEGLDLSAELLSLSIRPDGIFCANDTSAVASIKTAKRLNISVPEELAIVGFNDDPICEIVDPPLSSISHPSDNMGRLCVQKVLSDISEDIKVSHNDDALRTNLIARSSSLRK